MKNIDSKLNAICSKYKEIEENLLQQNNLDRNILVRLNKEYAELKPLVEKITIYKQCIKNIKDLEELKNDTDVHIRNEADKELKDANFSLKSIHNNLLQFLTFLEAH